MEPVCLYATWASACTDVTSVRTIPHPMSFFFFLRNAKTISLKKMPYQYLLFNYAGKCQNEGLLNFCSYWVFI